MSRITTWLFIAVSALFGLPLIAILIIGALDSREGWSLLRAVFLEPRAFEVSVEISVEGERRTISRHINCIPYHRWEGLKIHNAWQPEIASFGESFGKRGAVSIVTPSLCGRVSRLNHGQDSKDIKIAKGHVPFIRWVDDPANPQVMEEYIAKGYFERVNARVRYHGMVARAVPSNAWYVWFRDEEPLDFSYHELVAGKGRSIGAFGYSAWVVTESEWSVEPEIANSLRGKHHLHELSREAQMRLWNSFPTTMRRDGLFSGLGLLPGPAPYREGDRYDIARDLVGIVPLLRSDGRFLPILSERGYVTYYTSERGPNKASKTYEITFQTGDQSLGLRIPVTRGTAVFDPESQAVFQIVPVWIPIPKPNEH